MNPQSTHKRPTLTRQSGKPGERPASSEDWPFPAPPPEQRERAPQDPTTEVRRDSGEAGRHPSDPV